MAVKIGPEFPEKVCLQSTFEGLRGMVSSEGLRKVTPEMESERAGTKALFTSMMMKVWNSEAMTTRYHKKKRTMRRVYTFVLNIT